MATAPQIETVTPSRTLDASRLNVVANDPHVRPWLGGHGALDLSGLVGNPDNFTFEIDGGGFVCARIGMGLYEVHSLFLPSARRHTRATMRQAMDYIFTKTDCIELVTKVPDGNIAAMALAKDGGFTERFHRDAAWDTGEEIVGVSYLSLGIENWALRSIETALAGVRFHNQLESAKMAAGSMLDVHPDDPAHDAMVGAAFLMANAGNADKGVAIYNRWAAFAGYAMTSVISTHPVVIDVVDAVVEATADGMEILLCR